MLSELEDPNESFNAVAKRHNASSATLYAMAKKHRPNLIAERKESGVHKQIIKTVEVTDEQREAAVQAVLGGRPVKDVAADTGVPAPTLYKWVSKAKSQLNPPELAILSAKTPDNAHAHDTAVLDVLLASIRAASSQFGTQPEHLCDLLKARL